MARGHWLDPLARQILRATGQLTNQKKTANHKTRNELISIEKELEALKEQQEASNNSPTFCIDVNRAKASDWKKLPGCTTEMIELLMRLQRGGVQLSSPEDLFKLLEIPNYLAKKWRPYLTFHWYGSPPPIEPNPALDINTESPAILQKTLNWPRDRINRLLRERQRKPFKDLADLQERLSLPASTIEKLIGEVQFGSKPAGPILPPTTA